MATMTLSSSALAAPGARNGYGLAGTALTQGMVVCKNADGKLVAAQANAAATAAVVGICLNSGSLDAPLEFIAEGELTGLTGITVGQVYVLSDSVAGDIMPIDDLAIGNYVTIIGYGKTETSLQVKIINTGLQLAL